MATACDLYISPPYSRTWRTQAFPAANPAVIRMPARELTAARRAWNFFEEVEAADAATRVRFSDAGGWNPPPNPVAPTSIWYSLSGPGVFALYKKGQQLHRRICPNYDWTSQRNLGIPTTPLLDVGPNLCAGQIGGEAGADAIWAIEPTVACSNSDQVQLGSTRSVPSVARSGTRNVPMSVPNNSPKTQSPTMGTPKTTTPSNSTPKTSTPADSNTPKTSTPADSNTPHTTTPIQSNTPQPPSTPVQKPSDPSGGTTEVFSLAQAPAPAPTIGSTRAIASTPSTTSPQSTQIGTPRQIGSALPTGSPLGSKSASHIGTPRPIGSALATGSPLGSKGTSQIGTPRQIGATLAIKSPSQSATPQAALSQSVTRPASPPAADLIELVVSEKQTVP